MFERRKQEFNQEIILYGGDLKFPPCDQNFGQILLNQMALHSVKIAQIDPMHNITYTHADIRLYTIRCALEMHALGVRKGDVITICGRNHSNVVIPFLAATYLGAVSNPIHPNFSPNEIRRMISLTEPRMMFCDPESKAMLLEMRNELGLASRIVTFDNEFEPFIAPHEYQDETFFQCTEIDPENDNMFIVCTSGTTGLVKGVTIRHAAFYTCIVEFLDVMDENDRVLIYSPLSWVTAICTTGLVLYKGATKFICEFEPTTNLKIISEYNITWALFSPLLMIQMIRHPLFNEYPKIVETLKRIIFCGMPSTDEQVMEFRRVFKNTFLFNGYGSSEGCLCHVWFSFKTDGELNLSKMNSSGRPCPGSYVKVIDPDTGKTLGPNEPGELLLKSPSLTKGYYKNPEATAEAIDQDGWYHSGDMVQFDEDHCFYVIGRYKDLLKYRSWQVSPAELEEVIRTHSAVHMVCVMGKPHETDGDLPMAFIVKKNNMENVTEQDIINFVNGSIVTTMFERNKQKSNQEIILYGGDLKFPPCDQNFGQILLNQMALHSVKIAQIDPMHNITYTHADIRLYTIRCALEMHALGVRKGDVITICGRNHSNVVIPFLAATYLGAVSNPIHPNYSTNEIRRMISLTEPRMMFCDPESKAMLLEMRNELGLASRIVTFDNEFEPFIAPHEYQDETFFQCTEIDPENDNMFIVCTSGTTGLVKGVTIRHAAFYTCIVEFLDVMDENDRVLFYSPLSWLTAIWATGVVLYKGATKFICEFEQTTNFEIISEYNITWALFSPLLMTQMIRHPLFNEYPTIVETLKYILFCGMPSTDKQVMEFRRVFKNTFLFNGYGSSESCLCHVWFSFKTDGELNLSKMNSSGRPCPGSYVKVIDPDTGKTLGPNEPGELLFKGPSLTKGYYKNPEATAQVIDQDGWYHSGDMVQFDEDHCFYVIGRYKDLFKYRSWQVSPAELEEVIRTHSAVHMVCVMGKPHETDGELPMAFIVKKNNMENVTEQDIINFVNERVSDYQKLRGGVLFLDSLPMTASEKFRRMELKKMIQ